MIPQLQLSSTRLGLLLRLLQAPLATTLATGPQLLSRQDTTIGTGKTGLGWNNPDSVDMSQFYSDKVSWYYTWSAWEKPNSSLEFVPMFWGMPQVDSFTSQITAQSIAERGIKNVLGMNEPQEASQGNFSAQDGATMWKTYLEPLKAANPSLRLGSPATSNDPSGKIWLQDFFNACVGCNIDFVAVHWYGTNLSDFIAHVADFHYAFSRPVWVTEFACQNFADPAYGQCSEDEVVTFLNITQNWLDTTDYVERYSYFGALTNMGSVNEDNRLLDADGKITDLGEQYIGKKNVTLPGSSDGNSTTGSSGGSSGNGGVSIVGGASPGIYFDRLWTPYLASLISLALIMVTL